MDATSSRAQRSDGWPLLIACLTAEEPSAGAMLQALLARALEAGARPFEAIVGAPLSRYGARLTLVPRGDGEALARALEIAGHPWGAPSWIGLRADERGARVKAYHRASRLPAGLVLPPELPALTPVMASWSALGESDGDRELYLRADGAPSWAEFARACLAPLGGGGEIEFAPSPRACPGAFGVSLRFQHDGLTAITLYASARSLPDDEAVAAAWGASLDAEARRRYELARAGVRSLSRRRIGGWHHALSWTLTADGAWHRAASLRLPRVLDAERG